MEEKVALIDTLQKEVQSVKDESKKFVQENEEQVKRIAVLTTSLEESKKMIEDNNHGKFSTSVNLINCLKVIDWLHKQLNEDALTRPSVTKPFSSIDFNKYSIPETSNRPESFNISKENSRPPTNEYSRARFTSIESAGGFERASPIPPQSVPLGVSRAPSAFSSHNAPARNKSPKNAAYHHFNVHSPEEARPVFTKSGIPTSNPKSNYF